MELERIIESLYNAVIPSEKEVIEICSAVFPILLEEDNLLFLDPPTSIVGDIHGQFFDLLNMFTINGFLPSKKYLFLGDCVDRGAHSVETILLLLCLKIKYKDSLFLLRGNHESLLLTKTYGFKEECLEKYGLLVYFRICSLFTAFPLAAVINKNIFCVHGGIVEGLSLNKILEANRLEDHPALCGLLWSDPSNEVDSFVESPRGEGFLFGEKAVREFMRINSIKYIVRSHQLVQEGYLINFGCVYTIWSAPNYCYSYGNLASIMSVHKDGEFELIVYEKCAEQLGFA